MFFTCGKQTNKINNIRERKQKESASNSVGQLGFTCNYSVSESKKLERVQRENHPQSVVWWGEKGKIHQAGLSSCARIPYVLSFHFQTTTLITLTHF